MDIVLVGMIINLQALDRARIMPLCRQRKILTERKQKQSKSAPPVLQSPSKRIKRKQWNGKNT